MASVHPRIDALRSVVGAVPAVIPATVHGQCGWCQAPVLPGEHAQTRAMSTVACIRCTALGGTEILPSGDVVVRFCTVDAGKRERARDVATERCEVEQRAYLDSFRAGFLNPFSGSLE
jgi:hypothetical protein